MKIKFNYLPIVRTNIVKTNVQKCLGNCDRITEKGNKHPIFKQSLHVQVGDTLTISGGCNTKKRRK